MSFTRTAGIAGITGFLLDVVFVFALGADDPEGDASGAAVLEWVVDNEGLTEFRLALGAASIVLAVIFLVGLFGLLRARERDGEDLWSFVGLIGGVLSLAAVAVAASAVTALVVRVDELSAGAAELLWDLGQGASSFEVLAFAIALVGFSAAIYRTRAMSPWVAYAGFVGAVLALIAGLVPVRTAEQSGIGVAAFIALLIFELWTLVVSVLMVRAGSARRERAVTRPAAAREPAAQ